MSTYHKTPVSGKEKPAATVKRSKITSGLKTYSAKPTEVVRTWHLVDATETTLGRVATEVAQLLSGKKKTNVYFAH